MNSLYPLTQNQPKSHENWSPRDFYTTTLVAAAGPGIMPDRILAQAGSFEEPETERRCLFTLTVWHIFLLYISMTLYLRKRRFCSRLPLLFTLVYDRNIYFGLGPLPKPKPKLADTFGRYCNQYRNHISKGGSKYR